MALADLRAELTALRETILEITQSGTASGSLTAGGGSESYTRLDLPKLYARENELLRRIQNAKGRTRRVVNLNTGWQP